MTDSERIEDLTRERNQLLATNLVAKATIATLRSEHLADAFLRHAEALAQIAIIYDEFVSDGRVYAGDALVEIGRVLKKLEDG